MHVYLLGFGLKQIVFKVPDAAIATELAISAMGCEINIFISEDV